MSPKVELLLPLQEEFLNTVLGQKRKVWFTYALLSVVVPFTSSITSNLLRTLQTLFGLEIQSQRFYAFMGSPTLPWKALWRTMWKQIPNPATEGRIMVALDDSINPKSGKKIFGCGHFHNHATKGSQNSYPWSQCILAIGLLKVVKSRWVCLPLDFRFYMMLKDIKAKSINAMRKGKLLSFESKMEQAATTLKEVQRCFQLPVLIVADSWFGNNGLWSRLDKGAGGCFNLLTRVRTNLTLYDFVPVAKRRKAGRPRKYGNRLGSVNDCAVRWRENAQPYAVSLYSKKREVLAYSQMVMLKTIKCPVRIVWVYRQTRYVAIMTTDLELSVKQIIEYYGARWKIDIFQPYCLHKFQMFLVNPLFPHGNDKSTVSVDLGIQAVAVSNHLDFCMMATTLTWIYACRLEKTPNRRHAVKGRNHFAFSDVRRLVAKAAMDDNFTLLCPVPRKSVINSFVTTLLRMAA